MSNKSASERALKPSYRQLLIKTWPFILANMAVPILSLVDTAVIGHFGLLAELGALAVGGVIFNFVYWGFGFLRMGSSGLIAQAYGAQDFTQAQHIFVRSCLLALVLSLCILALQWPMYSLAIQLISAPVTVNELVEPYFSVRIWGAPATLLLYVVAGVLIGIGDSRSLFFMQLFMNGLNVLLDILFAGYMGWGIQGVAYGTLIAEYTTLILVAILFYRSVRQRLGKIGINWAQIFIWQKFNRLLSVNFDILLRTLFLLFSFAWFTHTGAGFGEATLAANHILLQLISFSAFFLDGYAHVVEGQIGYAIGARSRESLTYNVRRTSVLAVITALFLAGVAFVLGELIIRQLTDIQDVLDIAISYLPYVAVYIAVAVAAFQLDGIFIGASYGQAMRNGSIIACIVFLSAWYFYFDQYGNAGLWLSFIIYVLARAFALFAYYPKLTRRAFDSADKV